MVLGIHNWEKGKTLWNNALLTGTHLIFMLSLGTTRLDLFLQDPMCSISVFNIYIKYSLRCFGVSGNNWEQGSGVEVQARKKFFKLEQLLF